MIDTQQLSEPYVDEPKLSKLDLTYRQQKIGVKIAEHRLVAIITVASATTRVVATSSCKPDSQKIRSVIKKLVVSVAKGRGPSHPKAVKPTIKRRGPYKKKVKKRAW